MLRIAAILAAAATVVAAATEPTFSQQWSATVTSHTAINQGGQNDGNGNICCPFTSPECKVQTGYQASKQYFDLPNNRTANAFSDGTAVIALFNDGKEYEVNSAGACQSYCPIQGEMFPFGINPGATDKGASTYNGKAADLWTTTSEFPILNVTMSTTEFYLVPGSTTNAVPIAFVQQLTPFGEPIGGSTNLFENWTNGAPDASHFVVTGKESCPKANNCAGSGSGSGSGSGGHSGSTPSSSPSSKARYLEATATPFGYSAPSVLQAAVAKRQ